MKHILVIDDSVAIRKAIRRILEGMGYAVSEAEDGARGLQALEAQAGTFQAVLCDIDMPVLDGIGFLHAVGERPALAPPPIIMCTTHTAFERIQTALSSGATEYIMKPFDAAIIGSKLEACGVQ
ncbi:MAG: response regulator [Gemmatimonadaceae bacterium]|nr:response regulator [Gemmatimonadaceae bacterium]